MRNDLGQLSRSGASPRLVTTTAGFTILATWMPTTTSTSAKRRNNFLTLFPTPFSPATPPGAKPPGPPLFRAATRFIAPARQHSLRPLAASSSTSSSSTVPSRRRRQHLYGRCHLSIPSPLPALPEQAPKPRAAITCASASAADSGATAAAATAFSEANARLPFWKTYMSRKPLLLQALFDCLANIRSQEAPLPDVIDVAMVYVSSEYLEDFGSLVETLRKELPGLKNVFGCTGFGVIGVDEEGAREVEAQPALSLTLVTIPQAEVIVRHLDETNLPDGDAPPDRWSAVLGVPAFPESPLALVVLSDPSFAAVQDLLAGLDFAFPTATKLGGLSSSSSFGGSRTATFCWSAASTAASTARPTPAAASAAAIAAATPDTASEAGSSSSGSSGSSTGGGGGGTGVYTRGAVVMCIFGEVKMDLMVAQGCRPLTSTTWTVDRVDPANPSRVAALSSSGVARGRSLPALEAFQIELQSVLSGMSEAQLRKTVANLTVGVAPEGLKASLEPQDFLIRALRGFDSEQSLVVGEYMRVGQRVRFMVRDKQGAQEDLTSHGLSYKRKQLQAMLQGSAAEQPPPPFGMFMFTCNGRGSGLYGEDSYDARTMSSYVPVPCAGFQCNGEIGRVGNTTHLHGFTCAVGVLRLTSGDMACPPAAAAAPVAASSPLSPSSPPAPPPSLSPGQQPPDQQQQQQQQQQGQ